MATHHIAEDDLELYEIERLPEAHVAPVEEHLLVCEDCRAQLAAWDQYVGAMRAAIVCTADSETQANEGCRTTPIRP